MQQFFDALSQFMSSFLLSIHSTTMVVAELQVSGSLLLLLSSSQQRQFIIIYQINTRQNSRMLLNYLFRYFYNIQKYAPFALICLSNHTITS